MAKVSRPLFSDEATGMVFNSLCFSSVNGKARVSKRPEPRIFSSVLVKKQQNLFQECVAAWNILPQREKSQYAREKPRGLSTFAYYLSLFGVAKKTAGFSAPVPNSFSGAVELVNLAMAGSTLFLLEDQTYGHAVLGPFDLSEIKTVISGAASWYDVCAYGHEIRVFISIAAPGFTIPPDDFFIEVFQDDELTGFVSIACLNNLFLWVKIVMIKLI